MTGLREARAQLELEDPHANRRAAWFARLALEDAVAALLAARRLDVGERASGRTKLTCLESLYRDDDPALVAAAQYAWSRLSEACHQHAFEMTPTRAEVVGLVDIVASLVPLDRGTASGP